MIDGACLQHDRKDGQAIAACGRLLYLRTAIGPEHSGNCYRAVHSNRVAVLGPGEFAIHIDHAFRLKDRRGVSRPTAAIKGSQWRRRRRFEFTEDHGERVHRRAGYILVGIAAAGHDYHRQHKEEDYPPVRESGREGRSPPGEMPSPGITLTRIPVDLSVLHFAIVSQDQAVPPRSRLLFPEKY